MTTTGHIHFAQVDKSPRLQRIVELLKKADAPMSGMEITLQAFVPNASTDIGEIRQNEGYVISKATMWHDGKYRYWLIAAPGWTPRWTVNEKLEVVTWGLRKTENRLSGLNGLKSPQPPFDKGGRGGIHGSGRMCLNPHCGRPLPVEGPPFCEGEVCKRVYFESMQGKLAI